MLHSQRIRGGLIVAFAGVALAACDRNAPVTTDEPRRDQAVPSIELAADTVESLAADPERMREVMRRCKIDDPSVDTATCEAASRAYRRRFMGDGDAAYVPEPVDLFPVTPDTADAAARAVDDNTAKQRTE